MSNINIILGFDFGIKRMGVAVGNGMTQTAQPITILNAKEGQPNWDEVETLVQEWQPECFVVGIPYTADGNETEHILRIRKFMKRLHGRFHLPVFEVDEHASSLESEQYIKPSKRMKKGALDAISAAIIIERWFAQKSGLIRTRSE